MADRSVIYTALFGPHDDLKEQPTISGVDYICFTDQPVVAPGWEIVQARPSMPDRLAAKLPKMRPERWVKGYTQSIWIDASIRILSKDFPAVAFDSMHDGIALFAHPLRDCIYEEAEASKPMPKYDPTVLDAQVARYRTKGFPEHAGLWACGIIARDRRRSNVRLGRQWFKRCRQESVQDQISFPPLLRKLRIQPGTIPGELWSNDLIEVCEHHRES